ncbi:diguanylate cyclase [uncultured Selenomonas sp.]|uniref:transporter substrate-binding domain-containing diguanylate cyclase n=1 Tax=uncultured Selenomonas sp. TaxID=159275 RepID=UPI002804A699|nr:diguanylate cyclase [uncultured Selenomonas sp.]
MNIKTFFLCLTLSLLAILLPAPAAAPTRAEDAHAAVRVGCVQPDIAPELSSVITQQQVAYLTELSKYTDWNITPVPVTADTAMEKLLTGEIDLVLPVEPHIHAADTFVATQPLALRDLIALYSRPGEDRFSAEDLRTLDGTLEDRPEVTAPFENFCAENGLSLKLVPYATAAAARTALANGSIDLLIDTATNNRRDETFLLAFDSKPMSIAGLRAKAPLIRDLDAAAAALTRENPLYTGDYTRDFLAKTSHLTLHFSSEETALIESLPPLRVVLPETLQTKDVVRELIETVAKGSGLRVTFLSAGDVEAARLMISTGTADIMPVYYTSQSDTTDAYYTMPLFSQAFVLISRRNTEPPERGRLAIAAVQPALRHAIAQEMPGWQLDETNDDQHALSAVTYRRADLALCPLDALQATRLLILHPELTPSQKQITIRTSLCVSAHQPRLLQAILNKTILRLDPQVKSRILLRHETNAPRKVSLSYLLSFYPLQIGLLLGLFLLLIAIIIFMQKIIQRRALEAQQRSAIATYRYQAETDALTGVYNKAAIESLIRKHLLVPPAPGRCHALIIADLDHFKEANDSCGHQFGDALLAAFAAGLRAIVRTQDLVGRFGGDEFLLLLVNAPRASLPTVATRINDAARRVDQETSARDAAWSAAQRPPLSASIGIAVTVQATTDYDQLFAAADRALYHVKQHGRTGWAIADELPDDAQTTKS